MFKIALYALAAVTSATCMILLLRSFVLSRVRLVLWCAICFIGLTISNVLLFIDLVILTDIDLRIPRLIAALAGLLVLLYALVWNSNRKKQ
jgi:hypothetical protein